jgi:hypothetical protein
MFKIKISPVNKPPYFDKNLTNITVTVGNSLSYPLPKMIDPEGDEV